MHAVPPTFLPPARIVPVPGRGEMFVRAHLTGRATPVLLLLHGWTASADTQFVTAYEELAAEYDFVAVDHRGHGRGIRTDVPFSLEDVADDTAGLIEALGLGPVVAVGYSMGGPVAMLLRHRHPDLVRGLVLAATALEWRATRLDRARWLGLPLSESFLRSRLGSRILRWALARTARKAPEVAPLLPWLSGEMRRNDVRSVTEAGHALSQYDARPWASSVGVPTTVLVTTRDRFVDPAKQRALAAATGAEVLDVDADHLFSILEPAKFSHGIRAAVDLTVGRLVAPAVLGSRDPAADALDAPDALRHAVTAPLDPRGAVHA
jgi:3-oxoadipate enol-lactonase